MKLEFIPLLQLQRGQERFRVYLKLMLNADASDVRLPPLIAMNPMGKEHIPAMLDTDTLLAMDADIEAVDVLRVTNKKKIAIVKPITCEA